MSFVKFDDFKKNLKEEIRGERLKTFYDPEFDTFIVFWYNYIVGKWKRNFFYQHPNRQLVEQVKSMIKTTRRMLYRSKLQKEKFFPEGWNLSGK
jgi:hypothetical protein